MVSLLQDIQDFFQESRKDEKLLKKFKLPLKHMQ